MLGVGDYKGHGGGLIGAGGAGKGCGAWGLGGVERVGKPFRKLGTVARAVKRVGWGVQGVALRG